MKNNKIIIIIILIICLYHLFIQNGLEKLFFQSYFNFNNVKRPSERCNNILFEALNCIGMPSGHSETATIFFTLLYLYNFIPLYICIIFILIFCIQRITSKNHTIVQVIFGIFFGLIYTSIYYFSNLSFITFIIILLIGFILCSLSVYKLDEIIYKPVPKWVNLEMIPSIKKKQNIPFYIKFITVYCNSFLQEITIIDWNKLEEYLNIVVDNIKKTNINFDSVIGIKTGGAIISNYIAEKLNIPNYKIKLSREEYNCNKNPIHTINDKIYKNILKNYGKYTICEKVNFDLQNKNVILIDEMISSGTTMNEAINYLQVEKKCKEIYPVVISFKKSRYVYDRSINYILPEGVLIWPWGYDN